MRLIIKFFNEATSADGVCSKRCEGGLDMFPTMVRCYKLNHYFGNAILFL